MVRERIRLEIEASEWSQHSFSRLIGVATPNLNAFLKGTRTLPYSKLIKALELLRLTVGPKNIHQSIMPPSEIPEIFRLSIEHSGKRIKEVSDETGIDASSLSLYLNGARPVPLRNIEKIMRALDFDVVSYLEPKK